MTSPVVTDLSAPREPHSAVRYECLAACDLSTADWTHWTAWQQLDQRTSSPFYRPEFTQLVEATRGGVEVGVARDGRGEAIGFLPFHRQGSSAEPVGVPLNDFQGPILAPGVRISMDALLSTCRITQLAFDHVPASFPAFSSSSRRFTESPFLDLSGGFSVYAGTVAKHGSSILKQCAQYVRRVEREIGPLRLVWNCPRPETWDSLATWKSRSYESLQAPDLFAVDWIRRLFVQLPRHQAHEFAGLLTAIYAGEVLLAVHLGLQSRHVLHWWIPTYNPEFAARSPGTILLAEVARHAAERGVTKIDLGKGSEAYKVRFRTGATIVNEGVFDRRFVRRNLRQLAWRTRDALRVWLNGSKPAIETSDRCTTTT